MILNEKKINIKELKKTKGLFAGDRPEGKMKINYRVKEIYRLEEKKLPKRGMKKKRKRRLISEEEN